MQSPRLAAATRDVAGRKVKTLRANGQVPAVLYGYATDNKQLVLNTKEFSKLIKDAGYSTLIDLEVDGNKPVKVLIQDDQYDPLTGALLHADFLKVKMDEKLQTEIALNFVGESSAVKDLGGTLVTTKNEVTVEAFPQDLIPEIEVDITPLASFDDKITVADLKVPSTITIMAEPEETIAVVTAPRTEEELEAELAETSADAEAAAVAATEEASTEKKEEEEAAE